uniref:Transposase (Putative), gypsy type n=1 Tax=Tanacetum cinerariifolium TaxID=118510 RepID=A0A699H952_TANCI|nr:hypothetical protein [Tanacetum cinerariifolium]
MGSVDVPLAFDVKIVFDSNAVAVAADDDEVFEIETLTVADSDEKGKSNVDLGLLVVDDDDIEDFPSPEDNNNAEGAFRSSVIYSFDFSFPPHHMSSGPNTSGDAVVLKFDMHVYTSVLTSDEVKNLVAKYAIPSDLHPYVRPSGLTMNRLPVDKIVLLGLNRLTMFEIYCHSLEINPTVNLFRAFYKLNKQGHWFSFERRSGKGSQVATSMSEFLRFPMAGGVRVGKGKALADNERVVEVENDRVLTAKRKAQAAKDKAAGKRPGAEGTSRPTKKKKGTSLTFTFDDSEEDDSVRTDSGTHHSTSPLNTIILDDAQRVTREGCEEGGVDHSPIIVEDDTKAVSPPATHHSEVDMHALSIGGEQVGQHASGSSSKFVILLTFPFPFLTFWITSIFVSGHTVSFSFGGSAPLTFPWRNPSSDVACSFLAKDKAVGKRPGVEGTSRPTKKKKRTSLTFAFDDSEEDDSVRTDSGTHHSTSPLNTIILDDAQRVTSEGCEEGEVDHSPIIVEDDTKAVSPPATYHSEVDMHVLSTGGEQVIQALAQIDLLQRYEALSDEYGELRSVLVDDLKNLQQEHLGCVGKEADLIEKLSLVEKDKDDLLNKNREQEERIKRHWHLDSSGASCVPGKARHLAIGTWTHLERLAFREVYVAWPLALGLIRNVLRSGKCTLLGHWHLDSSGMSCISGSVCRLAIGTWTHLGVENT